MSPFLLLASSSPYRRELLGRLGITFDQASPDVDESRLPGESVEALVSRLARKKAEALATRDRWVLASDQAAALGDAILGKPGSSERACEQLHACSGNVVTFHTSICLLRDQICLEARDETRVHFRKLADDEIARYVASEQPLDCAGSFRAEGLGIALFDALESRDPTAIIGLPLITVAGLLRSVGFQIP